MSGTARAECGASVTFGVECDASVTLGDAATNGSAR